jgi:coenzyme F420 hydrogenase subunit beta
MVDKEMKKEISIRVIEENDLCISCGACVHICPFDNITMNYIESRGKYDGVVTNDEICLKCNGSKNCLAVCPSYNVDYEYLANASANDFLGKIENVYNGYAKNESVRFHSSSGGFIRELSKELLERKEINGIISIAHDEGLNYTPKVITNVSKMPNSIYHNINYENAVKLLEENEGKYLVIGLPCQITSIEQLSYKKKFAFLKERIYAKVALICGYTFERSNMEFFANVNHVKMDKITYRESGRFRKTRLFSQDESLLFDVRHPKSIFDYINNSIMFDKWIPQKHCLFCIDHIGYNADIVVGDAWQERYKDDKVGTNIIIARTPRGDSIIKKLKNIVLEKGNIDEIEQSQHIYAKPFLGLSMAKENMFNDTFIVQHRVASYDIEFTPIVFSYKDRIKIKYLKQFLREKKFRILKYIYVLLEVKIIIKLAIKLRLVKRKIL